MTRFACAGVIFLLPAVLVACGGEDQQAQVEATIRRAYDAYNQKDVAVFMSQYTDRGIESQTGSPRAEAYQTLQKNIGDPPATILRVQNTQISDGTATIEVDNVTNNLVELAQFSLIEEGGIWKIDRYELLSPSIPDGTTAVDVKLVEGAVQFDAARIQDGNIAFRVRNEGKGPHELTLLKVSEAFHLEENTRTFDQAQVEEQVAFVGPFEPGEEGTMVFAKPLKSGHYAIGSLLYGPVGGGPKMIGEFRIP